METKIPYSALKKQNEALILEFERLKAAEQVFHRQNVSLRALHETSLGLIDKLDKEELLENILDRAASLSGTAHGYIYLLEPGEEQMQMRVGMGFFKGQLGRRVVLGQGMGGVYGRPKHHLWLRIISPGLVAFPIRSWMGFVLLSGFRLNTIVGYWG